MSERYPARSHVHFEKQVLPRSKRLYSRRKLIRTIALSQLLGSNSLQSEGRCFFFRKRLNPRLARRPDPPPVPDQHDLAKKSWLKRAGIEPRHISAGILAGHAERKRIRHHTMNYAAARFPQSNSFLESNRALRCKSAMVQQARTSRTPLRPRRPRTSNINQKSFVPSQDDLNDLGFAGGSNS